MYLPALFSILCHFALFASQITGAMDVVETCRQNGIMTLLIS
jgi:hypothetical protein